MRIKMENLKRSTTFSYLLQIRLNWSKNVHEERDAPWQLMLPSINSVYCVYLHLALWLEVLIEYYPHGNLTPFLFGFSTDTSDPKGAELSKGIMQDILGGHVFKAANIANANGSGHGPLGTHSVRKLASTHSRRSGATKDERDIRGRWKNKKRVADVYDDIELPWPDIKVASMLYIGGPCRYRLEEGVSDEFVLHHVVPNIRKRFDDETAVILGTALLYLVFCINDNTNNVPINLSNRIRTAYANSVTDPTILPVRRVPIVCTGNEGEIYIDEILTDEQLGNDPQGPQGNQGINQGGLGDRPLRDQIRSLQSQLMTVKGVLEDIDKRMEANHTSEVRQIQSLHSNIKRFANAPAQHMRRIARPNAVATLSACPRTLYELWDEYTMGAGGRKAAREFNAHERGALKYKYYRRKILWDLISRVTATGLTSHVVCDRIYQHYGRECSITQIIKAVRADNKRGFIPPMLRVGNVRRERVSVTNNVRRERISVTNNEEIIQGTLTHV